MNNISNQRGATLIIALVILVLMTMLSITGMQTTILEEKMAGNMADNNAALQSAEAALREAEVQFTPLQFAPIPISSCGAPPCQLWELGQAGNLTLKDNAWWSANGHEFGDIGVQEFTRASEDPRYIAEHFSDVKDDYASGLDAGSGKTMYRLTARGKGSSDNAEVILQSSYSKRYN